MTTTFSSQLPSDAAAQCMIKVTGSCSCSQQAGMQLPLPRVDRIDAMAVMGNMMMMMNHGSNFITHLQGVPPSAAAAALPRSTAACKTPSARPTSKTAGSAVATALLLLLE
jgi:hypothetical protein